MPIARIAAARPDRSGPRRSRAERSPAASAATASPDAEAPGRAGEPTRGGGSASGGGPAGAGIAAGAGSPGGDAGQDARWRTRLGAWVTSGPVQRVVVAVIVLNAITLGIETSASIMGAVGPGIRTIDTLCLAIFVVEIAVKLVAFGPRFFRDGWNVFDLLVVGIALVPGSGPLSVLRSLRVLRVLRLVSALPRLRFIIEALIRSLPGIGSIAMLLGIIFYVSAVMATSLFGQRMPEYFGEIGDSLLTLFQIMTLDSWTGVVVRPLMETDPWAWLFFVVFILASAFTMLNLFIAVIVDTMQNLHAGRAAAEEEAGQAETEQEAVRDEVPRPGETEPAANGTAEPGGSIGVGQGSAAAPQGQAEAASLEAVLAELRALRAQVAALRE